MSYETEVCMCCNSVFSNEVKKHNFVCENCHAKWVEFDIRQKKYNAAFEEISFHLLDDNPSEENIRNAKDVVNRILEEELLD